LPVIGVDLTSFGSEDGNELESKYLTDAEMRRKVRAAQPTAFDLS